MENERKEMEREILDRVRKRLVRDSSISVERGRQQENNNRVAE